MRLLMLLNILIGRRGRRYISQDSTHNTTSNFAQPLFIHTTTSTNIPSDDLKITPLEKKTYITFPLREKKLPYNKKKLVKNKHTFTKKKYKKFVTQITFSLMRTHQKKRITKIHITIFCYNRKNKIRKHFYLTQTLTIIQTAKNTYIFFKKCYK